MCLLEELLAHNINRKNSIGAKEMLGALLWIKGGGLCVCAAL